MKLSKMRASVIGKVMDGQPTNDFPFPFALVDHIIFNSSGDTLREYSNSRGNILRVEPWMVSRFECQAIKKDDPECLAEGCNSYYYLDLPFEPMEFMDDAGMVGVYLQEHMLHVQYVPVGRVGLADTMDTPPSQKHPAFTRIGSRLYFWGGSRKFTNCKILIDAVVGGIPEGGLGDGVSCPDDVNVPIPGTLSLIAEGKAVKWINEKMPDPIEEGNQAVEKNG